MFGNFFNKFIPCGRIKRPHLGRSDLPECRADAPFLFDDVYKNSTRGEKKQADVRQYGRSMVEMLGVLAIIGVLSVGGLAGYSKAMEKYKLNKYTAQLSELLTVIYQVVSNRQIEPSAETVDFAKYLRDTKQLPDGLTFIGYHKLRNALNQNFVLYYMDRLFFTAEYRTKDDTSLQACIQTFEMIKEFEASNLQMFNIVHMCGHNIPCEYYVHTSKPINGWFIPTMSMKEFRNECLRFSQQGSYYLVVGFTL